LDDPAPGKVRQRPLDGGNQVLIVQQPPDGALIEDDDSVYLFG
jgi:hypothetical protein